MQTIELETGRANQRIALRGIRVRSRISALCQKTTVEQTFINLERVAIEAVYTFPLPESAAVCGFEVITGDRVLTGKIDDAEKAIVEFDSAIQRGDAAYLLDVERPDVFTIRVGNLKPKQAATIKLTYVCPLDRADRSLRVTYPTTIAPRYISSAGMDPLDAAMDGDALNPPHVLCVPYGLSMEVDVQLAQKIGAIRSPSHEIHVQQHDESESLRRITLAGAMTQMDRDIVLAIELAKEHEPAVQVAVGKDPRESYLAVTFVPEFDVDELKEPDPCETVFVLDCSGSMQGNSIAQATSALELCLRALSPGGTFNICRFGSTFEMMSSEPLVYSDSTLRRALDHIARGADLGGTELYAPLETILTAKPHVGTIRNVILLSDGQVSNEPAVIALARKHRAHNRIFTFGIGPACSAFLMKGLARATGGAAEFISSGERIDEKVLRTFSRIASPLLSDVVIDWGDAEVQTLAELPPVFDGEVLTIFGRALGRRPKTVILRCLSGGKARSWSVPVSAPMPDDGLIATMWARRMIQSMEEVNDIRRSGHSTRKSTREQKLVMDLSREFGVLSSLTSFIAVEHRTPEERNDGKPELRRIPVMLAHGWGGLLMELSGGVTGAQCVEAFTLACKSAPPSSGAAAYFRDSMHDAGPTYARKRGFMREIAARFMHAVKPAHDRSSELPAQPEPASRPSFNDLQQLLSLQSADGWFDWTGAAEAIAVGKIKKWLTWRGEIETALAQWLKRTPPTTLVQTVLMLVLLNVGFEDDSDLWSRAYEKALRFIARNSPHATVAVRRWLQELATRLQAA